MRKLVLAIWIAALASAVMFAIAYSPMAAYAVQPTEGPSKTPRPSHTPRPTATNTATPTNTLEPTEQFVNICHHDQGKPEWKEITINVNALQAHLNHQWGADIYPVPEGGCPVIEDPTATLAPTDEPTEVPSATPTDTTAPTDESTVTPTDTDVPDETATATSVEPTAEATPTVTPTRAKVCLITEIGALFHLQGPDGQTAWFGSYQRNPNNSRWAIPNAQSQQKCVGFIAVNIDKVRIITIDCQGRVNIVTVRCEGGGCAKAYEYNGSGKIPSRARGGN